MIEPLVSEQWFVRTEGMAQKARRAVEDGSMQILPERFEKIYFGWLDNIHDWCVSRQLWWGHRIPVYYLQRTDGQDLGYVVARNPEEAQQKAREKAGPGVDFTLRQDEDVLDTWFRSGDLLCCSGDCLFAMSGLAEPCDSLLCPADSSHSAALSARDSAGRMGSSLSPHPPGHERLFCRLVLFRRKGNNREALW